MGDLKPDVVQYDFVPLSPDEMTPGQKMMVEDGLPLALVVAPEVRKACWKGKRAPTITGFSPAMPKPTDPGTIKLLADIAARDKAQRKQVKAEKKERAIVRARQKPKKEDPMAVVGPKELQIRNLPARQKAAAKPTAPAKPAAVATPKPAEALAQQETTTMKTGAGKAKTKKGAHKKAAAKKAPTSTRRQKPARAASPARQAVSKTEGGVRPGSKLEAIVGLLQRPEGCTTAQVLKATDWPSVSMPQQAKAAGIELHKEKVEGVTVYRDAATVKKGA